ncbi:MAG TPA: glycine cleavage system protein H [Bacteroidota bacterium]|nr:glycine cleavage system protein H [Bacteroidota bacterium]
MTVLLVLFTLVVFLTADHFVQRARARRVAETVRDKVTSAADSLKQIPAGVELAINHTWMKKDHGSVITVGFDEFIARFFGKVERIVLPAIGDRVENMFLMDGERSLPLLAPVSGKVVAVNRQVLMDPSLAYADPYDQGWLLKVEVPSRQAVVAPIVSAASDWLKQQIVTAREFFLGHPGAVNYALMQDGGTVVDGVLKMYDNAVWAEFGRTFLAVPAASKPAGEPANR